MTTKNNGYVIRTKMGAALIKAVHERANKGTPMDRPTRKLVRLVLTNEAKGVGVKYDSSKGKKNKVAAESAVMKVAA